MESLQPELDVITKPRTNYSSQILRRAVPNINIQSKRESITMAKLKVLSYLKFNMGDSAPRKVKTVQQIPKILTIISNDHEMRHMDSHDNKMEGGLRQGYLQRIEEREDDVSQGGGYAGPSKIISSSSDFGSSDDSSIDGGMDEDEQKMYEQIIATQNNRHKEANIVDDLIDKDMIELLKVCGKFQCPSLVDLKDKMVSFGQVTRNKVLVLDMDETLIHSRYLLTSDQEKRDDGDFIVTIQSASEEIKISVKLRPYLNNSLEHLAKYYEIAVFTAGEQSYADAILDYLDEERQIIRHRLYRQHCVNTAEGIYVKDLRIISDRNLEDVILVDNSIVSFAFNLDNGVPISAFIRQ